MERTIVRRLSLLYTLQGGILAVIMAISGAIILYVWHLTELFAPLIVSFCYMLFVELTEALTWRWVASSHADSLPTYYTAVSCFRLLLALCTMFVYYLVSGRESMFIFFLVFMAFYVVQLTHHSIFFAKVSNQS